MQKRRIPATLATFHWYLITANEYLQSIAPGETLMRGEILGMSAAELLTLNHFKKVWSSDDPLHPGVWDLHSHKDKKTAVTRQNVLQVMSDFSAFFRPILMRIAYSPNITNGDRDTLNIANPVTKRSRPTAPIAEKCVAVVTIIGTGRIKVSCHYMNESKRACKPPRADAVEIAYRMILPHQFSPDGKELPMPSIIGPDDNTTKIISTRASFIAEMGAKYQGYQMQFFARWINTKHPSINGPWTGMWGVFIG